MADIHLIIDDLPIQFNLWRNIARLYSPARSVLALDVDFFPDKDLHSFILRNWEALLERMVSQKIAFVVPTFEFADVAPLSPSFIDAEDANPSLPETKEDVVAMVSRGELQMFHQTWFHGQGHTNYTRWLSLPPNPSKGKGRKDELSLSYPVRTYHFKYEPYVLVPQEAPFCDERFLGYGSNKCACIYELKAAGFSFNVLPTSFVIHRPHPSGADRREGTGAREKENQENMDTMRRFIKDMELKYGLRAPE